MGTRTYVIVGCGVAGDAAARAAREQDPNARVVVLTGEPHPFYARIRLGEVLEGKREPDGLVLHKQSWYEERNIELRTDAEVEKVDPAQMRVYLEGGESFGYDGLLLATGARPFVPPVQGMTTDSVWTLRTMKDALELREVAGGAKSAVMIGGGLLGLEASAALRRMGLKVTTIEVSDWLLPRQLDQEGGDFLQSRLEALGLRFITGARVASADCSRESGGAVTLADGTRVSGDLILVAAGVRPRLELAKDAGVGVEKGIVVNDRLETSIERIFAAGDCAEHRGRVYGLWSASEEQGRMAGKAIAGGDVRYEGTLPLNSLKVAEIPAFSVGRVHEGQGLSKTILRKDDEVYTMAVTDEADIIVGGLSVGEIRSMRRFQRAIASRTPLSQFTL